MESQEFLAFQDHILILEYLVQRWFDFFVVRGMYCTDFNLDNLELLRFVSWRIYLLKIVIFRIFHGFLYVSQRVNQINHHHLGQKSRGFPAHFSPADPTWGSPAPIPKGCSPAPESHAGSWEVTFFGGFYGAKHGNLEIFIDFYGDSMVKYMGILWGFYGKYPGNGDFSIDFRYSWCENGIEWVPGTQNQL